MSDGAAAEMPRYRCHKEVWALKIRSVDFGLGDAFGKCWITPEDHGYAKFEVPREYMDKHSPQPGGYYVVYADGYQSYSPAKAFEEGYTRI